MKITVSHSGKQHSYHLAKALLNLGALDKFYTSSYVGNSYLQDYFLKSGNTFFTRRFEKGLSGPYVNSNWRFEVKEVLLRAMYGRNEKATNAVYDRDMSFDAFMAKKIKTRSSQAFWGFQGSCLHSLKAAKNCGKTAIIELAAAHYAFNDKLYKEELLLHPEFADTMDFSELPAEYLKRILEEPFEADKVIAASKFTAKTLIADGVSADKIKVLPLGFTLDYIPYKEKKEDDFENRPLRLLYAGALSQRKGIKYLLEAIKVLKPGIDVELTLLGAKVGSGKGLEGYKDYYTYHPRVNQAALFDLYSNYDALVQPSISEGFGLVIVEAMAAGLPVIATENSMGPEVIENGSNGYIVPIRDAKSIAEAIFNLRELNNSQYLQMRKAARKSVEAFTWDAYAIKLSQLLPALL